MAQLNPTPTPDVASATGGISAALAALIAAAISGAISVTGFVVTAVIQKRALKHAAARDVANAILDFRLRQLNDLYGPLLLLLAQSERLAKKIREGRPNPEKWRMLDHVDEVLKDPEAKVVALQILEIGNRIEDILLSKAGLALGPEPPETFALYLGHVAILRLMLQGRARPKIAADEYYPRQLNEDVREGYGRIQSEIDRLRKLHEDVLQD
jgi:hypothetical protein